MREIHFFERSDDEYVWMTERLLSDSSPKEGQTYLYKYDYKSMEDLWNELPDGDFGIVTIQMCFLST